MKMLPWLGSLLSGAVLLSSCASAAPDDYAQSECADLRTLIKAQDYAANIRGRDSYVERNQEELRQESGSPWTGRTRTRDESNLRDERAAIRDAYRRKGCKA